jgi:hypothetical protein
LQRFLFLRLWPGADPDLSSSVIAYANTGSRFVEHDGDNNREPPVTQTQSGGGGSNASLHD